MQCCTFISAALLALAVVTSAATTEAACPAGDVASTCAAGGGSPQSDVLDGPSNVMLVQTRANVHRVKKSVEVDVDVGLEGPTNVALVQTRHHMHRSAKHIADEAARQHPSLVAKSVDASHAEKWHPNLLTKAYRAHFPAADEVEKEAELELKWAAQRRGVLALGLFVAAVLVGTVMAMRALLDKMITSIAATPEPHKKQLKKEVEEDPEEEMDTDNEKLDEELKVLLSCKRTGGFEKEEWGSEPDAEPATLPLEQYDAPAILPLEQIEAQAILPLAPAATSPPLQDSGPMLHLVAKLLQESDQPTWDNCSEASSNVCTPRPDTDSFQNTPRQATPRPVSAWSTPSK